MSGLSTAVRVCVVMDAAEMRLSFDGPNALASDRRALDPLSGHLIFSFFSARRPSPQRGERG